jgi:ABC-type polysaccharide/polyol phosphate transport system ATPase subunit
MEPNCAIIVENLSKAYSLRQPQVNENGELITEHWGLKNMTFEIKKGESVGIVGDNGSGKSTLLKILAGIIKPTSGKAIIKGKVASILDIGAGFHPELSGRENIYLHSQIHGFSRKEVQVYYDEIVAFSGIKKFIDEPVKNYSNGMYLRLSFSIMAHLNFDVYLFDEVLSVGDEDFQDKCLSKIIEIRESGKTLLIIHHNLLIANSIITRTIRFPASKSITTTPQIFPFANDFIQNNKGDLKSLELACEIIRKSKSGKVIIAVKTMSGINLAVSDIITVNDKNNVIELNLQLSKGKFRIEIFDIENSHRLIHSINYLVLKEEGFVQGADYPENTLIFNSKLL